MFFVIPIFNYVRVWRLMTLHYNLRFCLIFNSIHKNKLTFLSSTPHLPRSSTLITINSDRTQGYTTLFTCKTYLSLLSFTTTLRSWTQISPKLQTSVINSTILWWTSPKNMIFSRHISHADYILATIQQEANTPRLPKPCYTSSSLCCSERHMLSRLHSNHASTILFIEISIMSIANFAV